jgi:type II secretory pathway predicted ATPase ExeA
VKKSEKERLPSTTVGGSTAGTLFAAGADGAGTERKAARDEGPRDACPYADFARAAHALARAIDGDPFYGLLVGASGTGKSSLLRHVAAGIDRHRTQVVYIAQAGLRPVSIGRLLAQALHVGARRTHAETQRALGQVIRDQPQRLVVLVDEAQRLPADTLEDVRLLAEGDLERTRPLFSIVFAGPPELRERLDAPELFGLKRRIGLRLELVGLKVEEARPFLEHRLGREAAERLSPDALALLFERSRGVPALLEAYASTALKQGAHDGTIGKDEAADALDTWEGV